MPFSSLLIVAAVVTYGAATFSATRQLRHDRSPLRFQVVAGVAVLCHLALVLNGLWQGQALVISLGTALSLFAVQAALLLWLFNWRQPITALGLVVYPVAALCLLAGLWLPAGNEASAVPDWPLQVHILLSLVAYGVLTLGAAQAGVLAVQHRRLHDQRPRSSSLSLPPLQTMEHLLFRLILAGFFLLSLAILSGGFFIDHLFAQHLAHKTILSITAWIFFAVLLWGRWRFGWRGRVAVRWTLAGYGVLILAYFGSKLVLELILGEHWT